MLQNPALLAVHYLGDKLRVIQQACAWLKPAGLFIANLDMQNFRLASGASAARPVMRQLRAAGIEYNSRRKLLICNGRVDFHPTLTYLGADDQAGPNYTGQPVVNSYYAI